MAVTLNAPYKGIAAGTVVQLPLEEETALRAQSLATAATLANITSGAKTEGLLPNWAIPAVCGQAAVAIGASSVVVSNAAITANMKGFAVIGQSGADATFTQVLRVSCAAGSVTITGNANATAATIVNYVVFY